MKQGVGASEEDSDLAWMLDRIRDALVAAGSPSTPDSELRVRGRGSLSSRYDVTGLALASIAAAAAEVAQFAGATDGRAAAVELDRRLASFWFLFSLRPDGWKLPSPWDPIAGDYRARNGWIRLHTNAPHHRDAALSVLGVAPAKAAVEAAVAGWECEALEQAVVGADGCAAMMRSEADWDAHPQGRAVKAEPLIAWQTRPAARRDSKRVSAARPLAGIRVLDLTRVLAGPVATRFLAAYGAEVLRIDPPDWEEPGVVPEVTVGKRCAGLDLGLSSDRERFEALLADADILVHGYRPSALSGLGYDQGALRAIRPDLIDVALCAYGWSGPWSDRRGFDSLVQMSCGIAEAGQRWADAERPTPLPVQALDHATGYLMAAAAVRGLRLLRQQGLVASARLSLARTAALLCAASPEASPVALALETPDDLAAEIEPTEWGAARRLRFPVRVEGSEARFDFPARSLRSSPALWSAGLS